MRFPILNVGDSVTIVEGLGLSNPPKYLTCELEADHGGRHYDKTVGWWQFVPAEPIEPFPAVNLDGLPFAPHPNCRCELATVDGSVPMPAWWVAERCDEVFGPTSPELFFPILR